MPTKQDALRLSHTMREVRELRIASDTTDLSGLRDTAQRMQKDFYSELSELYPDWDSETIASIDELLYRQDAFDTWVLELPLSVRALLVEHNNLHQGWLQNG